MEMMTKTTVQDMLNAKRNMLISVPESSMVFDTIKVMSDNKVGSGIITTSDHNNEMSGIFTERDYIRKIILLDRSSKTTTVNQVMTHNVVTALPSWNLVDCVRAMAIGKFRHLPVVDSEDSAGAPIGIVSSRDVIKHVLEAVLHSSDAEVAATIRINDVFNQLVRKSARTCYVSNRDTVYQALEMMQAHGIGGVFVYKGFNLAGIFTERDYLTKIILQGRGSKNTKVGDVMTKNVISVGPLDSALETLKLMVKHGIRNIPVIPMMGASIDYVDGREYESIGMLTEWDLIRYSFIKMQELEADERKVEQ